MAEKLDADSLILKVEEHINLLEDLSDDNLVEVKNIDGALNGLFLGITSKSIMAEEEEVKKFNEVFSRLNKVGIVKAKRYNLVFNKPTLVITKDRGKKKKLKIMVMDGGTRTKTSPSTVTEKEVSKHTILLRQDKPSAEAAEIRMTSKQIPVGKIIESECAALGKGAESRAEIEKHYERYAIGLMNSVSVWLGYGDALQADRQKLASMVNTVDEKELFSFMSDVFYKDFKASYESERLLAVSVEDNKFNCYGSSVLFADVLARMGKRVDIIKAPGHVLLIGEYFGFETTEPQSLDPTFARDVLTSKYPEGRELEAEKLLSIAYSWSASVFRDHGRKEEELDAYGKAAEIDPKDSRVWGLKASLLKEFGRDAEAVTACDKGLEADPKDLSLWQGKGDALLRLRKNNEAVAAYDKGLEIDPENPFLWYYKAKGLHGSGRDQEALIAYDKTLIRQGRAPDVWNGKGEVLHSLGRDEEALAAYDKALEKDPRYVLALNNKGVALHSLGRDKEAEACFKKSRELTAS
jgi:tetratricopeptide (TPR) repeat protein